MNVIANLIFIMLVIVVIELAFFSTKYLVDADSDFETARVVYFEDLRAMFLTVGGLVAHLAVAILALPVAFLL